MRGTGVTQGLLWLAALLLLACGSAGAGGTSDAAATKHPGADAGASADPCPHGKHEGDYDLMADTDTSAIAACTEITGDLNIGNAVTQLRLAKLQTIGGALNITHAAALAGLDLPALTTIARELAVDGDGELTTFSLPVLESSETVLITNNPKLADFSLPALTRVEHLGVQANDALTTCALPRLQSVGIFVVNQNPALTAIAFDSLTRVSGDGFIVLQNPVLETLHIPLLKTISGDIFVNGNPMLPSCQVQAILAQLDTPVPTETIGDDDSATCP